jgi:hypothetical protein
MELRLGAASALAQLDARTPHVTLRVSGLLLTDVLRLDGSRLAHSQNYRRLPIDPGHHDVEIVRNGASIGHQRFESIERTEQNLSLSLPPPNARPTLFQSPWFWTIASVVVVGAGVGIAAGVIANQGFVGNIGNGIVPIGSQ